MFYLIVDGKRDDNNVYFLNGVTEADLMALAEKSDGSVSVIPAAEACTCTEKCEAGEVDTSCPVCKNDLTGCTGKEKPAETEEPDEPEQPKKDTGSVGTAIFMRRFISKRGSTAKLPRKQRPSALRWFPSAQRWRLAADF